MQKMSSAVIGTTLVPSATTNLVSCKPDCRSAGPHSWWAGGCAGTGIPSLGRKTSRTSSARRCRSPGGTAPAGSCSSTRTGSRKRLQTRPTSGPAEPHPRGRLWPACRHHRRVDHRFQSNTPRCSIGCTDNLLKFLILLISATFRLPPLNKNGNFRCVSFQTSFDWMEWIRHLRNDLTERVVILLLILLTHF